MSQRTQTKYDIHICQAYRDSCVWLNRVNHYLRLFVKLQFPEAKFVHPKTIRIFFFEQASLPHIQGTLRTLFCKASYHSVNADKNFKLNSGVT